LTSTRSAAFPFLILVMAGCAGSTAGSATSRSFTRPEAERIPLRRLAVWVASRPAVEDDGALTDVPAFPPPRLDQPLSPPQVDPLMQRALLAEIERWASDAGYAVEPAAAPEPRPTLRQLLDASAADAVLVVRVVPVDRFSIFEQSGEQQMIDTGDPATQMLTTAESAETRLGRLLVGQAFLYEPRSRVRVWSRQIPDFPEAGRLVQGHPFLRYGFVEDDPDAALDPAVKARRAAGAFVPAMLATLPEPRAGDRGVRQRLASADVQETVEIQRFLDRNHLAFQLSAGWELPAITSSAETTQNVGQTDPAVIDLPDVGTGELAPSGAFELRPELTWIQPGGTTFSATFEVGIIPNDFSRRVFAENVAPVSPDDPAQLAELSASGGITAGGSLAAGRLIPLSPQWHLLPEGGLFVDVWAFDVGSTIPDATHVVLGGRGELALLFRPSADQPFFLHAAAGGRAGWDFMGDFFGSLDLSTGFGLMF